jgi:hypothetical protein
MRRGRKKRNRSKGPLTNATYYCIKYKNKFIYSLVLWSLILFFTLAVWAYHYQPDNQPLLIYQQLEYKDANGIDEYWIDVRMTVYPDNGEFFTHKNYLCDFNTTVHFFNETILNGFMLGVFIDNAWCSYVNDSSLKWYTPKYFENATSIDSPFSMTWKEQLYLQFQASGDSEIKLFSVSKGHNVSSDEILASTIPVEPWSTYYQQEATRLTLVGMMVSVGITCTAIIAASKLDDDWERRLKGKYDQDDL